MKVETCVLSITVILAVASCAVKEEQEAQLRVQVAYQDRSGLSARLFREVNSYRSTHGAGDLERHPGLDAVALQHCEYLRRNRGTFKVHGENVSHFGSETRAYTVIQKLRMKDYSEIVAASSSSGSNERSSKRIVQLWQASKGHEPVMRNPTWSHTGLGCVVDADGVIFAMQVFATEDLQPAMMRIDFDRFQR